MLSFGEYIVSIITISLGCGILLQLIPAGGREELLRAIVGVILTVVILQPLSQIELDDYLDLPRLESESAEAYLLWGEKTADELKEQYITQACETYILNKAKSLEVEITPVIKLNGEYTPVFAEIQGTVDPHTQLKLEEVLIMDMGITKENQRWIGNPASGR